MNKITSFSHAEYKEIIEHYKPIIKDFSEVDRYTDQFCVLRHDIEFSIERALKMAEIDNEFGIRSSFFVQVLNTAYNPLSIFNSGLLKQIKDLGHYVGLHFYVSHIREGNVSAIQQELNRQVSILQECIDVKVDRFSYHRPPAWVLKIDTDEFSSLINTYSHPYFELIEKGAPSKVKYLADSNHKWNYGHPLATKGYQRFQLLIHPDEWSDAGGDDVDNFSSLISEARDGYINNINSEYKTFSEIRKSLESYIKQ